MEPEVHLLYSSDFYKVYNLKCLCVECGKSKTEFNEDFSISFIRTGNFYYHTFRDQLDSYTGSVLVSKPGYEYRVSHLGNIPDECTIIGFTKAFYDELSELLPEGMEWFFKDRDSQSLILNIGPETECLHDLLLQTITS